MKQTDLARAIAREAHAGQYRWDKVTPYITHPEAVREIVLSRFSFAIQRMGYDPDIIGAVALLHDVVEDTPVTLDDLKKKGVLPEVIHAVDLLTKKKDQPYVDYICGVMLNGVATLVKLADISHNKQSLTKGSMKDKYELAEFILRQSSFVCCY